jgi:hypothetical protein
MKVCIIAPGAYKPLDSDQPVIGQVYQLEDMTSGTEAQNKAFHALVGEYWKSGCSSYDATDFDEFRNCIKRALGAGFEAFIYVVIENGEPVIKDAKTMDMIPEAVRKDPRLKQLVRGRLKSWSDYTKKERRETMDRLISEMHQAGVQSKKFQEILGGMDELWGVK